MQPVFAYRPESYPPRNNSRVQWPQFGDDVLEDTLSISESVRQALNEKRAAMAPFHRENLEHHGLLARAFDAAPPPPALVDPGGPQEELPFHLAETEESLPRRPGLQRGVPSAGGDPRPAGAIHFADDDLPYTLPDYPMNRAQRGSVQEGLQDPGALPSQAAPLRARDSFRTHRTSDGGLATRDSPQYATEMTVDELENSEMANRVVKREREAEPKIKAEPGVKDEKKVKIKQEPGVSSSSHRGPGSMPEAKSRAKRPEVPPILPDDDELQTVGVKFNNNEDHDYWRNEASAQEMRAQLNLRFPQLSGNWINKDRVQLLSTIRGMIRKNQWVVGAPSQPSARERSRSPPPAANEDSDVELSGVNLDQNTSREYWEQKSANYIRSQLALKFPNKRAEFSFFDTRKEYIDYLMDKIRKREFP